MGCDGQGELKTIRSDFERRLGDRVARFGDEGIWRPLPEFCRCPPKIAEHLCWDALLVVIQDNVTSESTEFCIGNIYFCMTVDGI